jgi:hypothetical protein
VTLPPTGNAIQANPFSPRARHSKTWYAAVVSEFPWPLRLSPGNGGLSRRTGFVIRSEMTGALDREDRRQSAAGAVDPAFDGADIAPADSRGFLIGEPGGPTRMRDLRWSVGSSSSALWNSSISR